MSNFFKKYAIASYYILALLLGAGITYLVVQRVLPAGLISGPDRFYKFLFEKSAVTNYENLSGL